MTLSYTCYRQYSFCLKGPDRESLNRWMGLLASRFVNLYNEAMNNVALLWDLENVNPGSDSLFLEGLTEFAEGKGRIVTARAYGNWTNTTFSKLAPSLTRRYFYLVHIPKGRKNSSDMVLVSDTLRDPSYP